MTQRGKGRKEIDWSVLIMVKAGSWAHELQFTILPTVILSIFKNKLPLS